MAKIELNNYDLGIRTTAEGDEVVQIKCGFDADFIQSMRDQGVKDIVVRKKEDASYDE